MSKRSEDLFLSHMLYHFSRRIDLNQTSWIWRRSRRFERSITMNPYCQILENSSRNFSKIFIFRVMSQTVHLENSSIKKTWVPIQFFFQKSGREPDHITGKLIQSSIGEFWGMTQTVLLENSSRPFFKVF